MIRSCIDRPIPRYIYYVVIRLYITLGKALLGFEALAAGATRDNGLAFPSPGIELFFHLILVLLVRHRCNETDAVSIFFSLRSHKACTLEDTMDDATAGWGGVYRGAKRVGMGDTWAGDEAGGDDTPVLECK